MTDEEKIRESLAKLHQAIRAATTALNKLSEELENVATKIVLTD